MWVRLFGAVIPIAYNNIVSTLFTFPYEITIEQFINLTTSGYIGLSVIFIAIGRHVYYLGEKRSRLQCSKRLSDLYSSRPTEIPMEAYLQRIPTATSRSQDNFKQMAEFSESESEREAHRRNRVIQMRLGVCLSEIALQQRSSAQIHKMEEARFLQKVKSRSCQPRSAKLLTQFRAGQCHVNTASSSNSWPLRARAHNTRSDFAVTSRMLPGQ